MRKSSKLCRKNFKKNKKSETVTDKNTEIIKKDNDVDNVNSDELTNQVEEINDEFVENSNVAKEVDPIKRIIDEVESGKIELKTNKHKGNYGEMKMDQYFKSLGYERISLDKITGLDDKMHQGIDGVYYNPDKIPPFVIAEAKYNNITLGKTKDGTQMSDKWIENRLEKAVGQEKKDEILNTKKYQKVLYRIMPNGTYTTKIL